MSITHPCSQWNLRIKLPARGKIIASCQPNMSPKHYIKLYKQQKWTLKKSRLTSFKKCIFHAPQLPPQLLVGVGTELGGGGRVGLPPFLISDQIFCFPFFRARKIPIIIRRYLPDGSHEDWSIDELIVTDWKSIHLVTFLFLFFLFTCNLLCESFLNTFYYYFCYISVPKIA